MRIAIVGGGAMGSTLAAGCGRVGLDVTIVDTSPSVVERINGEGIRLDDATGQHVVVVPATASPDDVGVVDHALVFVKAHHTENAALIMKPMVGKGTVVTTLQNGWGNADILARHYSAERIVIGVTYNSSTIRNPGVVSHTSGGPTYVGPFLADGAMDLAADVAAILTKARWPSKAFPDVKPEIFSKLVLNAAALPTSALTGLEPKAMGQVKELVSLVEGIAVEAVGVAGGLGIPVDLGERLEHIRGVLKRGTGKPSMLQDVENRRKTEVEVINGAIVRLGDDLGMATPLNQVMVALVRGLEKGWGLPATKVSSSE